MILLMMEEIKTVAVLTPGVPSVSKIGQFNRVGTVGYRISEGQKLPTK
jgi:hypothetical protein